MTHPKRPRDPNQLAKSIVDIATKKGRARPRAAQDDKAAGIGRVADACAGARSDPQAASPVICAASGWEGSKLIPTNAQRS